MCVDSYVIMEWANPTMYVHHVLERGDDSHMPSWIEVSVSLGCEKDENDMPEKFSFPRIIPHSRAQHMDKGQG